MKLEIKVRESLAFSRLPRPTTRSHPSLSSFNLSQRFQLLHPQLPRALTPLKALTALARDESSRVPNPYLLLHSSKPAVMDLCITAAEPFAPKRDPPRRFSSIPVVPTARLPKNTTRSILPPSKRLIFNLIIYNPATDDPITHPWDSPDEQIALPIDISKGGLMRALRDHLPTTKKRGSPPKLKNVTMYWTYLGDIIPMGEDEADWHFRCPINKTDLMARSELDWGVLKDMMAGSGGSLRPFLCIVGEQEKRSWWSK